MALQFILFLIEKQNLCYKRKTIEIRCFIDHVKCFYDISYYIYVQSFIVEV